MKLIQGAVCTLAFFLAAPIWAQTTIWGGFEDTVNTTQHPHQSDYDYNDLVFSMTGTSLTLHSTDGSWHNESSIIVNNNGTPFWDNTSSDGANMNVGFCIYGGGNCHGGVGLAPGANFLATNSDNSVNDVYFSVNGQVDATIALTITADTDTLGWEKIGSSTIHDISSTPGTFTFTPGGDFQLVGIVNGSTDYRSDSDDRNVSQFAFFESTAAPTPEPSSLMLLGSGLLGMAGVTRRRFGRK